MSKYVSAVSLGVCGLLASASAALAQTHGGLDDAALITARADGEWLTHGGDYAETRYSTLDQIDSQNVGRLGLGVPLLIVASQDLAPGSMGSASGMLMGFTWGTAGVLYLGIGLLQEVLGLTPAMAIGYLFLLPAALVAYLVLSRQRAVVVA